MIPSRQREGGGIRRRPRLRAAWSRVALVAALAAGRAAGQDGGIAYLTKIKGASDTRLERALEEQSRAILLQDRPPATLNQLQRRAEEDLPRLEAVLHARGYLDGHASVDIQTNREPYRVIFTVDGGSPYILRRIAIDYVDAPSEGPAPPVLTTALRRGQPAEARVVLAEEARLLQRLRSSGFPFPVAATREVELDHENHHVDLVFRIRPGPFAVFGKTTINGLARVKPSFVKRRIEWDEGDSYDSDEVDSLEHDLLMSGLFAVVAVQTPDRPGVDQDLPITLRLIERKHRTVRFGANYRSDIGPGGRIAWENRNLLGGGEKLSLSLEMNGIEATERMVFRRPDFLTRDLALILEQEVAEEKPDAYTSRKSSMAASLEYTASRHNTLRGGVSFKYSIVDQLDREDTYGLAGLPLSFKRDMRDNDLDPRKGWYGYLSGGPYKDLRSDLGFGRTFLDVRTYNTLSRRNRLTLALRLALGSIFGVTRDDVPADERFYCGGGGSVRGYAYESIGPRAEDGTPLGGKGLAETSVEIRANTIGRLGYVFFADGGTVFEQSARQREEDIQWGAGLGLRYDLGFAPLRLDVAFPLNKRPDDDFYQFYISIGQAF